MFFREIVGAHKIGSMVDRMYFPFLELLGRLSLFKAVNLESANIFCLLDGLVPIYIVINRAAADPVTAPEN